MTWDETLSTTDARLIDGFQSGVPVTERPFRAVADTLDESEQRTVARLRRLQESGIFRRVGPVLNPPVIGSSALAALAVPEDRFDRVAESVNGVDQVNHNYGREHHWNMWFVVTAATQTRRETLLDWIATETGCPVLRLPMRTQYYIDLEFPVVNDDRLARDGMASADSDRSTGTPAGPRDVPDGACPALTPLDRRLIPQIQGGFAISTTPYADVAEDLGVAVAAVLDSVERLRDHDCIKRIGGVVNHHAVGFDANCMVVWDVPDEHLDTRGVAAGRHPAVTYCCHRPRREPDGWRYNLFTMIHGRSREAVDAAIDELATDHLRCPHARLHTTDVLKQTGVRYRDLLEPQDATPLSP